jgi:integrase
VSREHRGTGNVYQPTYKDKRSGEVRTSAVWWACWPYRGKILRQSSKSTNRADAVKLLKRKLGEVGRGRVSSPETERTSLKDLCEMLRNDYRQNQRRSAGRVEASLGHLIEHFGDALAIDITTNRITAYVVARQTANAANATINRELAALKRMFRLAEISGKVTQRPYVPMLREDNARKGFFEAAEFQAVRAALPEHLKAVAETAYVTGWRIRSELLTRRWTHIDFEAGWIRLEPGETKNREGRMFPMTPTLRAALERQRASTRALEHATGQVIPWVFHRDGQPIRHFRRAWLTACKAAKAPHRIPHDFRRTAVRNLERAGVPRSAAMKMVGHKTEAMYRRYAIADESMLREGAAKLEALLEAQRAAFRVVVPLRNDKVSTKSGGLETWREGLSAAEITERIRSEVVGRDGIEPPTPGFSVLCSTN